VGDDVAVFVHGRARVIPGEPGEADAIRHFLDRGLRCLAEDWVSAPGDARYVEILPGSMYSYAFSRERFEALCEREAP